MQLRQSEFETQFARYNKTLSKKKSLSGSPKEVYSPEVEVFLLWLGKDEEGGQLLHETKSSNSVRSPKQEQWDLKARPRVSLHHSTPLLPNVHLSYSCLGFQGLLYGCAHGRPPVLPNTGVLQMAN